jgi:hypothetical protein
MDAIVYSQRGAHQLDEAFGFFSTPPALGLAIFAEF